MSRRTGKIASLPKVLRDQVNVKLRDGVTYAGIIDFLREDCPDLNAENVSHWFKGSGDAEKGSGYLDWLKDQERLEGMRERREFAVEFAKANEGGEIQEAALQLAASHAYEIFTQVDPKELAEQFKEKPELLAPLINATARGFGESQKFRRYRDEVKKSLDDLAGKSAAGVLSKDDITALQEKLKLL
jgi:hypothetical protein